MAIIGIELQLLMGTKTPITDHLSYGQLSHNCGLQTKYHRERVPEGPPSVSLKYGTALHAGLEAWALLKIAPLDPVAASDMATRTLEYAQAKFASEMLEATKKGEPIVFDGEPKLKKDGELYADQRMNIQNRDRVDSMLAMHIREFVRISADVKPAAAEHPMILTLTTDRGPQELWGRIDRLDEDGTITDYKTAKEPWGETQVARAKAQAYIYQAAYRQLFDEPPSKFQFQVFARDSLTIQTFVIPYDREAINQYIELDVKPRINSIDADVFIPNENGWWCSEKFCAYWNHCPLGAAKWPEGKPYR
jgi:hypothetical protein